MGQFQASNVLIAIVLIILAMERVLPAMTQPHTVLPVNKMGVEVLIVLSAMMDIFLIVLIKNAMVAQPIA
jgi:hypothetical protein